MSWKIIRIFSPFILVILVYIIKEINKKYFRRPKLSIEISQKNTKSDSSHPISKDGKTQYEFVLHYNIIIRNISEKIAYSIKLFKRMPGEVNIEFQNSININQPLNKLQEIKIPFEFKAYRNSRKINSKNPIELKGLEILLDYKNSHNTRFNSLYKFEDKKEAYRRIKKKKIKNNFQELT